ncbi:hypothetical protein RvY_06175 [Ramazzottius varieornatus]|uniref:Uncharacterized protein n=1 Tax=Ramazzottius varieornatus TaxID=947166 RepID=A0A1D1V170_RAMVA|nr:hypothetical protein RvY_06175 [Ramazzottius varieornatus]
MISLPLRFYFFILAVRGITGLGFADQHHIPRYHDPKTFFLPNYARSFPSFVLPSSILTTNPAYAPLQQSEKSKVEEVGTSFREDLTALDDSHGFDLGGELEARNLDLSPIFRQPASTLDLLRQVRLRLVPPVPIKDMPDLGTVISPTIQLPTSAPLPSDENDQHNDVFNPFFRPVYARPPPPPVRPTTTKGPDLCSCPCTSAPTTTEASPSVGTTVVQSSNLKVTTDRNKPSTTEMIKLQNTDVIVAVATEPVVSSNDEDKVPSALPQNIIVGEVAPSSSPSVAQLVQQAFNSARENNQEDNRKALDLLSTELTESNAADTEPEQSSPVATDGEAGAKEAEAFSGQEATGIFIQTTETMGSADVTSTSSSSSGATSTSILPVHQGRAEFDDVTALPVETTTAQLTTPSVATIIPSSRSSPMTTRPSDMVSTKIHVQEKSGRAPKKVGLMDELSLPVPKQTIPGFPAKGSNRRFNSLLDLSLRRGGHKA